MGLLLKITILCFLLACAIVGNSQFYLGLSANLGNRLSYSPSSFGLQNPPSFSGSIVGIFNEELRNNWILQYGGAVGVLGYNLKVTTFDTLTTVEQIPDPFLEYSTFYGKLDLLLGKVIPVGKRELMIGVGGGISYYYSIFPETSYSIGQITDDGTVATTFSADFNSHQTITLAFVKVATQLKLNERLTVGLEYSHSFKSIVSGTYEFYHTKIPSSGSVSLYPRELSLVFAVNTSKQAYTRDQSKKEVQGVARVGKHKTYLGFEFVVANDIYKITDSDDYLRPIPNYTAGWGFNVRQEVSTQFFMETGFMLKYYWEGFRFGAAPTYSFGSYPSWLIPVRGGMNINLYKNKIFLVPMIGYVFGINPAFSDGVRHGWQESNGVRIEYDYMESQDVSRYFSLLQIGAGFETKIWNTLLVNLSMNYYKGFEKINQLDINYVVNNTTQQKGTASSKGDFWCVDLGVKYPISTFWQR